MGGDGGEEDGGDQWGTIELVAFLWRGVEVDVQQRGEIITAHAHNRREWQREGGVLSGINGGVGVNKRKMEAEVCMKSQLFWFPQ